MAPFPLDQHVYGRKRAHRMHGWIVSPYRVIVCSTREPPLTPRKRSFSACMATLTDDRHVLRNARDGKRTYAAERWGVRELLHDLFSAPLIFPWRSHLLPNTPSARKLYARVLHSSFRAMLPCGTLDRQQWFHLVFDQLVRSLGLLL